MQRRPNSLLIDHEFLSKLAALGKPVEIFPGQHFDLEAPLATEQLQQILADLGIPMTD
jgi:hypothetical protein